MRYKDQKNTIINLHDFSVKRFPNKSQHTDGNAGNQDETVHNHSSYSDIWWKVIAGKVPAQENLSETHKRNTKHAYSLLLTCFLEPSISPQPFQSGCSFPSSWTQDRSTDWSIAPWRQRKRACDPEWTKSQTSCRWTACRSKTRDRWRKPLHDELCDCESENREGTRAKHSPGWQTCDWDRQRGLLDNPE